MKRKTKLRRRETRRTIYESALSKAQAELERTVSQRTDALMKLDRLSKRIPWLEGVVAALRETEPIVPTAVVTEPHPSQYAPQPQPEPTQEEWLQKYIPPTGRVTTTTPQAHRQPSGNAADPDEFLSDDGQGTEMLP